MMFWRFLKRYKRLFGFSLIIILGFGIRAWRLGEVPMSLTWDEVAITYDGWGIALDGHDHWGAFLPATFKSFGDYKAPLLPYMVALRLKLGGDLELAIRELALIFGVLMIGVTYFLSLEISHSKKIALLAMIFVAGSPWHIHLSRVGFEAGISATFLAFGILYFFKQTKIFWLSAVISAIFFLLAFYSYHSMKVIIIPILLLFLITLKKNRKWVMIQLLTLFVGLIPFISGWQTQITRASQTISLSSVVLKIIDHGSLQFLIGGRDQSSSRNVVFGFGILTVYELGLILICLGLKFKKLPAHWWLLVWMVLLGLIPSVLSQDSPHALRSTTILPYVNILSAWSTGILFLDMKRTIRRIVAVGLSLSLMINLGCFLKTYYGSYAFASARDFQFGYKQVMEIVKREGRTVDHIYMTDFYGEPYIYYLFYKKIKPREFLAGGTANVTFGLIKDFNIKNSLYIATPLEIEHLNLINPVATVYYPQSSKIAFVVLKTP